MPPQHVVVATLTPARLHPDASLGSASAPSKTRQLWTPSPRPPVLALAAVRGDIAHSTGVVRGMILQRIYVYLLLICHVSPSFPICIECVYLGVQENRPRKTGIPASCFNGFAKNLLSLG